MKISRTLKVLGLAAGVAVAVTTLAATRGDADSGFHPEAATTSTSATSVSSVSSVSTPASSAETHVRRSARLRRNIDDSVHASGAIDQRVLHRPDETATGADTGNWQNLGEFMTYVVN